VSTTQSVIRAVGLTKSFGRFRALDGLDLEVVPGEVHGFLGPNGAGKSTTIRVVLGLIRATGGHIELFGCDPWRQAALWPGLTGGQCLDVLGATQGGLDEARRAALIERFDLDPTKRVRDYSKGNRQKVALIAALAAGADLLVLDEPTSGLDPLMEHAFQEVVRERRDEGRTVLLSSHILGEVEALADRVTIIRRGRTVTTGSLAELRRHTRTQVHAVTIDAEHLDAVVGTLHAARIHTLTATPPSMDALFLRSYDGSAVPLDASEFGEARRAER
jgi:ABC-2 type transport system ATP-binding protein